MSEEQAQPTLKYLGTDMHSKKVLEGKFFSNVGPRRFGAGYNVSNKEWFCDCGEVYPSYRVKCDCGEHYRDEMRAKYDQ